MLDEVTCTYAEAGAVLQIYQDLMPQRRIPRTEERDSEDGYKTRDELEDRRSMDGLDQCKHQSFTSKKASTTKKAGIRRGIAHLVIRELASFLPYRLFQ